MPLRNQQHQFTQIQHQTSFFPHKLYCRQHSQHDPARIPQTAQCKSYRGALVVPNDLLKFKRHSIFFCTHLYIPLTMSLCTTTLIYKATIKKLFSYRLMTMVVIGKIDFIYWLTTEFLFHALEKKQSQRWQKHFVSLPLPHITVVLL